MSELLIREMDHIVLSVADIERSLAFYSGVLGLQGERVEEYRTGKVGFPSVRINGETIIDLMTGTQPQTAPGEKANGNLNHYCLVAEGTLEEVMAHLAAHEVPIRTGPASRWGARGRGDSVYILDPDGNEVELRCY